MKITTKQLAQTALLLAICIASQFFKGISPLITGPIINICLILCALVVGIPASILLGVITPVTSYLISGSPAFPLLIPGIMLGNIVIGVVVGLVAGKKAGAARLAIGLVIGSVCKAAVMGIVIVMIMLPMVTANLPAEKKAVMLPTLQYNFSALQLITALIASAIVFIIWTPLKKALKADAE
ncbi:MAG: ECF transporter S component [Lachnospiraceae bacterium]|nr:ECF transporter S component [Lachnospiraceae bacterium]